MACTISALANTAVINWQIIHAQFHTISAVVVLVYIHPPKQQ